MKKELKKVICYQLFFGDNYEFFAPSYGMAKIEKTRKYLLSLFPYWSHKIIWKIEPIKSEYGRPHIVKTLLRIAKEEHGEMIRDFQQP